MLSNKSFVIAGVAMLGTAALLGTNAANALIDLDATTKSTVATYAKETLVTAVTASDEADTTKYYKVDGGGSLLNVKGEVGVGGTVGSVLIVQYTFSGMVLTALSAPVLTINPSGDTCGDTVTGGQGATLREKGEAGDNRVSFILTRIASNQGLDALACLQLEEIAVSTEMAGSVRMDVSDNLPLPAKHDEDYPAAVRVESDSLREIAEANNTLAAVAVGFKSFNLGTEDTPILNQVATLGSFEVAIADSAPLDAADATVAVVADLYTAGTSTANSVTDTVGDDSSVTITGVFSFATKVTLDDSDDCNDASSNADLRLDETVDAEGETTRDTTALKPQTVPYFNANPNLCITVADLGSVGAVAIPETAPYEGTIAYEGGTTDAVFPVSDQFFELGNVGRDGTTVRLPYLTTNERFNQRIYIVNRGGAAKYYMTFHGEGDDGGMDADGVLAKESTTILSLRDNDVVTIGPGRTSTAGTIVVEQQAKFIDVATSQINRELGTSDTVVYDED